MMIYKTITELNIEEMEQLAEHIMHQLYMDYASYDEEGNRIFKLHKEMSHRGEELGQSKQYEELTDVIKNDMRCWLLYKLFRRGDDISDVRDYTVEDICPWIEPVIPKALGMFRKGIGDCSEINYKVADTVSDSYLIAVFACEVRNMMMIFAAQRMNEKNKT